MRIFISETKKKMENLKSRAWSWPLAAQADIYFVCVCWLVWAMERRENLYKVGGVPPLLCSSAGAYSPPLIRLWCHPWRKNINRVAMQPVSHSRGWHLCFEHDAIKFFHNYRINSKFSLYTWFHLLQLRILYLNIILNLLIYTYNYFLFISHMALLESAS